MSEPQWKGLKRTLLSGNSAASLCICVLYGVYCVLLVSLNFDFNYNSLTGSELSNESSDRYKG